jgi:hypothetical protein
MTRRWVLRILAAVCATAAVVALAVLPPAGPPASSARPTHPTHPGKTTTTGATTTTPEPSSTTVAGGSCSGPITVTAGGTYTGCFQSTDGATPAVTVATSEPVALDHAEIRAAGDGIHGVGAIRLAVTNSKFAQLDPGAVVQHRAIFLYGLAGLTVEHSTFTDTDGIWAGEPVATVVDPLLVRNNLATNIGRYPHPTSGNCCVQFLQISRVLAATGEVAWNHTRNTSGQSGVDDNINFYQGGGTDSAHRVDVHHNLIDGAYPRDPTRTDFTGGGILAGDVGGGHTVIHDNTVVSTTNYGVSAGWIGATDVTLGPGNVLVNDTFGSDGATHYWSDFGQANSIQSGTGNTASGYAYNWQRDDTGAQFPCWSYNGQGCNGGTQTLMGEQQARDDWDAARAAAGVVVGADW